MALKFDRSEPGVWVSGLSHAAILAAGLLAFAGETFPEAQEGIPVEIVTDNQVSVITRGERSAKQVQPQPKPRVDRVAERSEERDPGEAQRDAPAPPKRTAEAKVDDEPAEAAPPPTPPLRPVLDRPEPAPEPPPRPEAAKTPDPPVPTPPKREDLARLIEREDAEAQAQAEAKARAEAEARAKAAAEAKAKAEAERQKAAAEAKAKAEAERQKAKAEAEAKAQRQAELAKKFDAGDIRQLLSSKDPSQSSGATGRELNRTAALGTASGNAQRLNPSQRDALIGILQEQLHRCWVVPVVLQSAPNPPVPSVRVKLNPDGSLGADPAVMNRSSDPLFGVAADSAVRAARRCAPLKIPAQFQPYYQDWKDLVVNFNLRDMG